MHDEYQKLADNVMANIANKHKLVKNSIKIFDDLPDMNISSSNTISYFNEITFSVVSDMIACNDKKIEYYSNSIKDLNEKMSELGYILIEPESNIKFKLKFLDRDIENLNNRKSQFNDKYRQDNTPFLTNKYNVLFNSMSAFTNNERISCTGPIKLLDGLLVHQLTAVVK